MGKRGQRDVPGCPNQTGPHDGAVDGIPHEAPRQAQRWRAKDSGRSASHLIRFAVARWLAPLRRGRHD